MIYMQLQGGLGSQMWQYSVGRALSLERGVELVLDIDQVTNPRYNQHEGFVLQRAFGITTPTLSERDRARIRRWHRTPFMRRSRFFHWKKVRYSDRLQNLGAKCYVSGPLNDYRYFAGHEEAIRKDFGQPISLQLDSELADSILSSTSVAVHVRRGDYATAASLVLQPKQYFLEAAHQALDEISGSDVRFFVFSDDIEWAVDNLASLPATTFVPASGQTSWEAQDLMRRCQHYIISNSALSWWAAWLGSHDGSRIYFPTNWFTKSKLNPFQLERMPSHWTPVSLHDELSGDPLTSQSF
jgi:hypothetical protein